jgi:two-component system response regulator DevR
MTAPVRVFIVDDHPVVRAGLKELLKGSREIAIVGDAEDGESATIEQLESLRPDVVIVDIKLKRGNGIDVCRAIKSRFAGTGVIMLSAFWDDQLVRQALDARADGYLLKDAEHFDLKRSVLSVARGESFFDTAVSGAIARRARGDDSSSAELGLSAEDIAILRLVANGLTNKAIGAALYISHHTVRDRVSAIMAALGAKNRAEAAQIATRRSLI